MPLSCPRCEKNPRDWCCVELKDLKARIERDETMPQLLRAYPGETENSLRGVARRWKLGSIKPGPRVRRKRCLRCVKMFVPAPGQTICCVTAIKAAA